MIHFTCGPGPAQPPPQAVGPIGGGDADVIGAGAPSPTTTTTTTPAPPVDAGGDYSQCGVKNGNVQYDENGEDQEAIDRLNWVPELKIRGGWSAGLVTNQIFSFVLFHNCPYP